MKKIITSTLMALSVSSMTFAATPIERDTINQVALLQSLAMGYFDGSVSVKHLKTLGDTSIGTFDGLNGEMIVLDGVVYRADADCKINVVADSETIPFSNVTFFEKDFSINLKNVNDKSKLESILNQSVNKYGANSFYMIKLNATFNDILVRSEAGQKKPYKTLVQALEKDQKEKTFKNIKGTIVGLYCPKFMSSLNSVGWHFHFITNDKKFDGHVLELNIKTGEVQLDQTDHFNMNLPLKDNFQELNFGKDMSKDIQKAENESYK